MLGHDRVADYGASIPTPHLLKLLLEYTPPDGRVEQPYPVVTTECDEVEAALVLITNWLHEVDCSSRPMRWMPISTNNSTAAARIGNSLAVCRTSHPPAQNATREGWGNRLFRLRNTVDKHSQLSLRALNPSSFARFTSWFHTNLLTAALFVHFIVDFHSPHVAH